MGDYFGYNVKFVMNITDVDDKVSNKDRTLNYYLKILTIVCT
jgi:cysteinyl-tRNA synthetase